MSIEQELRELATDLLATFATKAMEFFGTPPTRSQISYWGEPSGSPPSYVYSAAERTVFDRRRVDHWLSSRLAPDLNPAQKHLEALIGTLGLGSSSPDLHWVRALLRNWIRGTGSLAVDPEMNRLLIEEFIEAATSGEVVVRTTDAIRGLPHKTELVIAPQMKVRPISQDELWEFGEREDVWDARYPMEQPARDWSVLETVSRERVTEYPPSKHLSIVRQCWVGALSLAAKGSFEVLSLGEEVPYGVNAGARMHSQRSRHFSGEFKRTGVDASELVQWPSLYRDLLPVFANPKHWLLLPLGKYVQGKERGTSTDSLLDFVTALEALLVQPGSEISYRLSLFGAVVQTWSGGDRFAAFKALRELYSLRSAIVHGGQGKIVSFAKRDEAGHALRDVLRWYLENGLPDKDKALSMIEQRLLNLHPTAAS